MKMQAEWQAAQLDDRWLQAWQHNAAAALRPVLAHVSVWSDCCDHSAASQQGGPTSTQSSPLNRPPTCSSRGGRSFE